MIKDILISSDLSNLRRDLTKLEEKELLFKNQKEFAELAMDTDSGSFISYFKNRCNTQNQEKSLPELMRSSLLTEDEFANPPKDTEESIFNSLRHISPRQASSNAFWASYHLSMIDAGLIAPSYLAKSQGKQSGRARIEKALKLQDTKPLDDCVRTILRRMGGLPEVRGYTSVFQDCRTSRAWWRGHFAEQVHGELGTERDKIWGVLRTNMIWEQITGHVVEKLTVLGDRKIFIPLIACLADMDPIPKDRPTIQDFLRRIGQRTAYQMMGTLSPQENLKIIREIVRGPVHG